MGQQRVAFALGGLGGNNAHGAGFLAAALQTQRLREERGRRESTAPSEPAAGRRRQRAARGLLPEVELVSCTSGAIYWVARYLQGADLRAELLAKCREVDEIVGGLDSPWTRDWRGPALVGLTGVPHVFRPVWAAYQRHWLRQVAAGPRGWPTTPEQWYDLLLPAQQLIPDFPDELFEEIADAVNDAHHGVGVVFNSFDPRSGLEHLHANAVAMELFQERHPGVDYGLTRGSVLYRPVGPADVRAALRLFAYGFAPSDDGSGPLIDGAYARSIILDELTLADVIYAVKPLNTRWLGRLPQNQFEVQDMQTERWFETAFREQTRLIDKISQLCRDGQLVADVAKGQKRYHEIALVPVEIQVQRGFFQYFVEDPEVFESAYHRGLAVLSGAPTAGDRAGQPSRS